MKQTIENSPIFLTSLQTNLSYSIVLINVVKYQASEGNRPIDRSLTDKNWIVFWNKCFKNDLIKRIKEIIKNSKDYKIINLYTLGYSGLHFL